MASFEVHLRHPDGREQRLAVDALSFPDALRLTRNGNPAAIIFSLRMLDSQASVRLCCAICKAESTQEVFFGEQAEAELQCPKCAAALRVRRERVVIQPQGQIATRDFTPPILGEPPVATSEHRRSFSIFDHIRERFQSPEIVEWVCSGCNWTICCKWFERYDVHTCPDCGCRQYVPANAFAWNVRVFKERERRQRAIEYAQVLRRLDEENARRKAEEEASRRREIEEREKRNAAAAAEQEKRRLAEIVFAHLADIAVGARLINSKEDFRYLSPQDIANLKTLSDLADALHADLMSAMDKNVLAEKGVAYGRPAAAGLSILSFFNGYALAGLAFGAVAVGARVISNDWKRAKMAEMQVKWAKILSGFGADDIDHLSRVFAYKYPSLAAMMTGMSGQLPK